LIEEVTKELNEVLAQNTELWRLLQILWSSTYFGRETNSAALGEASEHLVANLVGGTRADPGSHGFDVLDADQKKVEVKSRMLGRWGNDLMFDFSPHSRDAAYAFCIAWDSSGTHPRINRAFKMPVTFMIERWPSNAKFAARTTLGKIVTAMTNGTAPEADLILNVENQSLTRLAVPQEPLVSFETCAKEYAGSAKETEKEFVRRMSDNIGPELLREIAAYYKVARNFPGSDRSEIFARAVSPLLEAAKKLDDGYLVEGVNGLALLWQIFSRRSAFGIPKARVV